MATAELAACLPVLVLVLGVAISAVLVVSARVRAADAAREAARATARGDDASAAALVRATDPGARLRTSTSGGEVTAVVSRPVRLFGLPAVTVREQAVAAVEPGEPDGHSEHGGNQ